MVGNIATGKTSWIKKYLARQQAGSTVVISKDAIRRMIGGGEYIYDESLEPIIHRLTIDMTLRFMTHNKNVIYDETNESIEIRSPWLWLTKHKNRIGYDYHTVAAIMPKVEMDVSLNRRMAESPYTWGCGRDVWEMVWKRKDGLYQEPKRSEGFDEIWNLV
jgi:hypothetical protein